MLDRFGTRAKVGTLWWLNILIAVIYKSNIVMLSSLQAKGIYLFELESCIYHPCTPITWSNTWSPGTGVFEALKTRNIYTIPLKRIRCPLKVLKWSQLLEQTLVVMDLIPMSTRLTDETEQLAKGGLE